MISLKLMRQARELSLADASNHLGISIGTLRLYERRQQQPKILVAKRIADFYGVTLDDIVDFFKSAK